MYFYYFPYFSRQFLHTQAFPIFSLGIMSKTFLGNTTLSHQHPPIPCWQLLLFPQIGHFFCFSSNYKSLLKKPLELYSSGLKQLFVLQLVESPHYLCNCILTNLRQIAVCSIFKVVTRFSKAFFYCISHLL